MEEAKQILERLDAGNIFDLRGVVAVVTGGGTGIGLMISSTLVANGATVFIVGPEQAKLDAITNVYNEASKGHKRRGMMTGIQGDVSLKSEAQRIAAEVEKYSPHVTVLFNNAGINDGWLSPPPSDVAPNSSTSPASRSTDANDYLKMFWKVEPEQFDNTLKVNTIGPYYMSAAFLPLLERWKHSPGGSKFVPQIVMTSSMNGWTKDLATCGRSFPYLFSKSALGQFTSALAHELLPLGIRVNGIAPGWFISEMTAPGTADATGTSHLPEGKIPKFEIPVRQAPGTGVPLLGGTNRDMGSLALFLVANWFVNGETVLIDGGTLLRHPSSY